LEHSQPRQTTGNLFPEFFEVLPEGEQDSQLFLPSKPEFEAFLFLGEEIQTVLPPGQNPEISSPLEINQGVPTFAESNSETLISLETIFETLVP